eukprot:TRINITY_DN12496_c0_g1_i1.p1 TRINITY_DN12496_c0_g1~~TRINITY_DN12496_c0_g1_i1.p1  ORF type:complete len:447 (+),score=57.39 TRINITY_DN12496_c0_g1_i1:48-1343(+)
MERHPDSSAPHSIDINRRDRPRTQRNGAWVMKWGNPNSDDDETPPVNNFGRAVRPLTGFTGALKKESKDEGANINTGWIPPPSAVVRKPGLRRVQGAALQKRYPTHLMQHVEPDSSSAIPLLVSDLPTSRATSEHRSQSQPALETPRDTEPQEKVNYYKKVVPASNPVTPAKRRSQTIEKLDASLSEKRERHPEPSNKSTTRSVSAPAKERERDVSGKTFLKMKKYQPPKVATKPWVPAPWNAGAGHKLRTTLPDGHSPEPTPVRTKKVSSDRQPYLFDRDEPITGWDIIAQDSGEIDRLRGAAEPQWKQKPIYNNEDRLMVRSIIESMNQLINEQPSSQPLPPWISESSDVTIVSTPPVGTMRPVAQPTPVVLEQKTAKPADTQHADPTPAPEIPEPEPAPPTLYTLTPGESKPKKITVEAPPVIIRWVR